MPELTILDCARCTGAACGVDTPVGRNVTRAYYGDLASGFKDSYLAFAGAVLGFLGARQLQEQLRGATEMVRPAMWS